MVKIARNDPPEMTENVAMLHHVFVKSIQVIYDLSSSAPGLQVAFCGWIASRLNMHVYNLPCVQCLHLIPALTLQPICYNTPFTIS